jgi:hypothetical protein
MADSLMALFSKLTNAEKLEINLAKLNARATLLTDKRAGCVLALEDARIAGQQHLLSGDVDDEAMGTALRDRVNSGQSQLADIDIALAALAASIDEAEKNILAETHRIACEANAASLAVVVANIDKNMKPFLEVSRALAADLESLNGFRYQAAGLAAFFRRVAGEGEIALRIVIDEFAGAIPAVANGTQQITIGKAVAAPPVTVTAIEPLGDVFTYTDPVHAAIYRAPLKDTGQ